MIVDRKKYEGLYLNSCVKDDDSPWTRPEKYNNLNYDIITTNKVKFSNGSELIFVVGSYTTNILCFNDDDKNCIFNYSCDLNDNLINSIIRSTEKTIKEKNNDDMKFYLSMELSDSSINNNECFNIVIIGKKDIQLLKKLFEDVKASIKIDKL